MHAVSASAPRAPLRKYDDSMTHWSVGIGAKVGARPNRSVSTTVADSPTSVAMRVPITLISVGAKIDVMAMPAG